jgi:hypothetical protein
VGDLQGKFVWPLAGLLLEQAVELFYETELHPYAIGR